MDRWVEDEVVAGEPQVEAVELGAAGGAELPAWVPEPQVAAAVVPAGAGPEGGREWVVGGDEAAQADVATVAGVDVEDDDAGWNGAADVGVRRGRPPPGGVARSVEASNTPCPSLPQPPGQRSDRLAALWARLTGQVWSGDLERGASWKTARPEVM